jgi:hypothetical protein
LQQLACRLQLLVNQQLSSSGASSPSQMPQAWHDVAISRLKLRKCKGLLESTLHACLTGFGNFHFKVGFDIASY